MLKLWYEFFSVALYFFRAIFYFCYYLVAVGSPVIVVGWGSFIVLYYKFDVQFHEHITLDAFLAVMAALALFILHMIWYFEIDDRKSHEIHSHLAKVRKLLRIE